MRIDVNLTNRSKLSTYINDKVNTYTIYEWFSSTKLFNGNGNIKKIINTLDNKLIIPRCVKDVFAIWL